MRKSALLIVVLCVLMTLPSFAQLQNRSRKQLKEETVPVKPLIKKYPSLLWEISGKGLKKPSYLFGTMHVSDKLAFHLGDSFYNAIKSAEVVALETNPESWQDDFSKSAFYGGRRRGMNAYAAFNRRWKAPNNYMRITTFAIDSYDEAIKAALAVEPSMINGMLYRSYGSQLSDFEEDTFLDMYIFQVGKKLGKQVSGVENFEESEKLVMEAYRDMIRDQNKKRRSFDYEGMVTNPKKVEDAYRKGDLDMLDSLESLTVFSDAFQEKFLYKRNEIQANAIDSIIKKSSLFVGVGAAHLPGKRGVIEMLREKGYTVRPVQMDDRNSAQKEAIEKIRSNNNFNLLTSGDGFYKVAIPGKQFYHFTDWSGMNVVQYADMVNGAYYMVTRIKTNSLSWGHSNDEVYKKIDNLLYENVPGKIIKKATITRNGYKGFDITNRTRRGDYQRYQVFVTPFEIIVFKISGSDEYINGGNDAQQFFNSIILQEYQTGSNWVSWQPATGGFTVQLPHTPSLLRDNNYGTDRLEYAALDKQDGNSYLIMKVSLHNYSFIEEDTFELNLADESYSYSSFIDKQLSRNFITVGGYPALESKFRHKDGSFSKVRYIIQGPVYYVQVVRYKNENENVERFIKSFAITPFIYPEVKKREDTLLHIVVNSPIYAAPGKKEESPDDLEDMLQDIYNELGDDDENSASRFGSRLIGNDTIGEKILVTYQRMPEYAYQKDSTQLWKSRFGDRWFDDSTFIFKLDKESTLSNGMRTREIRVTDTGSSRQLLSKLFYKDGYFFSISTLTDTISKRSAFLENFFKTFAPVDTLKGESLFTRKSTQFFNDLFSADSATAARTRKILYEIELDPADVPAIKETINRLTWDVPDYLAIKKYFIEELGGLKDSTITPYLEKLYWKINDTSDLQHAVLNALLGQRTKESFVAFKNLVIQEPPIMEEEETYGGGRRFTSSINSRDIIVTAPGRRFGYRENSYNGRWFDLYDSLSLAKVIFPDFLQLMNVDDYREEVMELLVAMVDSGYLKAADYESYFSKIYLDAKQLLKKQFAKEDKDRMEKANKKEKPGSLYPVLDFEEEETISDAGNEEIDRYAILLMPFRDKNPGVKSFFEHLLKTEDRRLLYNSIILLLRNNQPVADSLFMKYAALDNYRSELYEDLVKMKKEDKFPKKYKNQSDITKSILIASGNRYDKMDTLVYLDKLPVTWENKKGFVYFYKFKRMRDDMAWQLASVGMQPEKQSEIDMDNDEFTTTVDERKLENDKPVKEQLQKMLKEMVNSKRESALYFYEARSYSLYKNYLSEMVKSRRYRD